MLKHELIVDLAAALGERGLSDDPVDVLAYAHDTYPLALKAAAHSSALARPDVVVWPETTTQVADVVRIAARHRAPIVPFGGGSGIVGGALPVHGGIALDLKRLSTIEEIDTVSRLVTLGAGTNGQRLEDHLNERGYTCGHYPQSLRSSTVGGWIAHRAIGTASTRYGGIEALVAGMEVVLPSGDVLNLKPTPRTAAGPDLKHIFLGGEGTLGIVTRATLRIVPLPESRRWQVFTYACYEDGLDAIRQVVQSGWRPAVVRLYDELEGAHLLEAGGCPPNTCLLLMSIEGSHAQTDWECAQIEPILAGAGGERQSVAAAMEWWENRFFTRGLLHTLQQPLGIADALEISAPWKTLGQAYRAMLADMRAVLIEWAEESVVYGHSSHAYSDGANLYVIFHAKARSQDEVALLYQRVLDAAFNASARFGGSLSHHHGIGLGKARWLSLEYGECGVHVLRAIQRALDPYGIMNPGKIGADAHA